MPAKLVPHEAIPELAERYPPLFQRLLALRPGMTSPASLAHREEERLMQTNPSRYVPDSRQRGRISHRSRVERLRLDEHD